MYINVYVLRIRICTICICCKHIYITYRLILYIYIHISYMILYVYIYIYIIYNMLYIVIYCVCTPVLRRVAESLQTPSRIFAFMAATMTLDKNKKWAMAMGRYHLVMTNRLPFSY